MSYLIQAQESQLLVSSFSHKGLVRENNEDNLIVNNFQTTEAQPAPVLLAVLADGVGGHLAGEIASRIGVETIAATVAGCENLDDPASLLEKAILAANQAIVDNAVANPARLGMGSTCVCALIIDKRLYIANLGDSRLYLLHKHDLCQLTYDHTWLEEIAAANPERSIVISRSHPLAHVLNRYLGSVEPVRVDLRMRKQEGQKNAFSQGMRLESGDVLLLTSDGVSDLLNDHEIKSALEKRKKERIAKRLVYCALKKGGYDNATVISIAI